MLIVDNPNLKVVKRTEKKLVEATISNEKYQEIIQYKENMKNEKGILYFNYSEIYSKTINVKNDINFQFDQEEKLILKILFLNLLLIITTYYNLFGNIYLNVLFVSFIKEKCFSIIGFGIIIYRFLKKNFRVTNNSQNAILNQNDANHFIIKVIVCKLGNNIIRSRDF